MDHLNLAFMHFATIFSIQFGYRFYERKREKKNQLEPETPNTFILM